MRVKLEIVLSISSFFIGHCSVVVITSASHAEGPQFEPGQCQYFKDFLKNIPQIKNMG